MFGILSGKRKGSMKTGITEVCFRFLCLRNGFHEGIAFIYSTEH